MSHHGSRHVTRLTTDVTQATGPDRGPSNRTGSPVGDRGECHATIGAGAGDAPGPDSSLSRASTDAQGGRAIPSRRRFLTGLVGLSAAAGLAACGGDRSSDAGRAGKAGPTAQPGSKVAGLAGLTGSLTFAFWGGSEGEKKGFDFAKKRFEEQYPGATVTLQTLPFDGFFAGIDRGLQAGNAPDLFRVDYTNVGKYAAGEALLDVTPYFSQAEVGEFLPSLWKAVTYQGVPYGLPHQTDVSAVVYDPTALKAAGVATPPSSLEQAWTWEQFADAATRLRAHLPSDRYPFAYPWTKAGAYRWFSWLYQAGGRIMNPEMDRSALDDAAGAKAMDFTRSFFSRGWVPPTNTIKNSRYSDDFFRAGTVPMAFVGSFVVPAIADPKTGYTGDWQVTFMPRDAAAATDLGGNAIVANRASKNPDLAAAFLRVLGSEECMRYFCEQSIELPSRAGLATADLEYVLAPDKVEVFATQARTLSELITSECSHPAFNKINSALQNGLETAFTSGADSASVLQRLAADVDAALR